MAEGCAYPIGTLTCLLSFLNDAAFLRFSSISREHHHQQIFSSTTKLRKRKCTVCLRLITSCCNMSSHGNSPAEILQQTYFGNTSRYNKLSAINSGPFGTHLAETYFMSSSWLYFTNFHLRYIRSAVGLILLVKYITKTRSGYRTIIVIFIQNRVISLSLST